MADYRKWMYHKHPAALRGEFASLLGISKLMDLLVFYLSCEMAGVYYVKEKDLNDWGIKDTVYKKR